MRYEFIKIDERNQVAYLLDLERGVVVVAPIEYTEETRPAERLRPRARIQPEEYIPEVTRARVAPQEEIAEEPKKPPMKRPPSIVPSHLRGVFIKPGGRGADTEIRET